MCLFLLDHNKVWRPLVWLRIGTDGSIYCGLLTNQPSYGKLITKDVTDTGTTIKYDEGQELQDSEELKSSRVSFKASGEIHIPGGILQGIPLETLTKPIQLCLLMFAHPERYQTPHKKLKNDYDIGIVGYPVDDSCPLHGSLFVQPWDPKVPPVFRRNTSMQVYANVVLAFRDLRRTPALALQLVIGHGLAGPWPELPGLVIVSRKDNAAMPKT